MAAGSVDHLILCYHGIGSRWPSTLAMPEKILDEQLSLLRHRGYEGFTFAEWERRRARHELPSRSVVVTFDDGYASTLKAVPILRRIGFPGTVFPVVNFVESGELMSWPGVEQWSTGDYAEQMVSLTWSQLEDLVSAGWEVGSHTINHPHLPMLDDGDLQTELRESRAAIAKRLGRCETVAYPYGEANAQVAAAAARAGYSAACTLTRFHLSDESHLRPRVGLYPNDTGARFRFKISRAGLSIRRSRLLARLSGGG